MRKLKVYENFVVESLLLRDDNLKSELRKVASETANKERLLGVANSLIDLSEDRAKFMLKELGYSDYLLSSTRFWSALKAKKAEKVSELLLDDEIATQVSLSKRGKLKDYLVNSGGKFTFGMLRAIFADAKEAKITMDAKSAVLQAVPRAIPLLLAPFYPMLAVIGLVLGTSRTFNKIIKPVLKHVESDSKYVDFLKTFVTYYMKVPEGDFDVKDRFSRAFVVSDGFVDAIKPEVLEDFNKHIIVKMDSEPDDMEVPDHYIENELKDYISDRFDVDPRIPLKEEYEILKGVKRI